MDSKKLFLYLFFFSIFSSTVASLSEEQVMIFQEALASEHEGQTMMYQEVADSAVILKRLQKAVHVLGLLEKNGNLVIPREIECHEHSICWSNATFYSMHMIMCIDHVCMQGSLEPLKCVWSSLLLSKNQNNSVIVQEFTKALLVLMYACIKKYVIAMHEEVLVRNSLEIKNLDSLSLEEMLIILDLLVKAIPDFLEKIEMNNHQLTWEEWIKKYWLIAPLSGIIVGLKIYLTYLSSQGAGKVELPV